jgi:uncharacterized protein (DUF2225 family)
MKETTDDSYMGEEAFRERQTSLEPWISIGEGFHSFRDKDNNLIYLSNLYECTIPKGSNYYYGFGNMAVSDRIVINKKVI